MYDPMTLGGISGHYICYDPNVRLSTVDNTKMHTFISIKILVYFDNVYTGYFKQYKSGYCNMSSFFSQKNYCICRVCIEETPSLV